MCIGVKSKNNTTFKGFTIVELLVVIVVIGILAAITIISYTGISQKATVASITSDLDNASKQLKLDQVTNSIFPATLAAANNGKGIPASPDTTYQYVVNNSITPQGFCITATHGSTVYKMTNESTPTVGDCQNYGLVLQLDAGNTLSYPGSGTTWTDLSGNNNNGTLMNGVGYSSSNGGVLTFDGVDDYVNAGNASTEQLANGTMAAWIKTPSAGSSYRGILTKQSAYGMFLYDNVFVLYSWNGGGQRSTGINLADNNWHFVACSFQDGVTNGTLCYIDGSPVMTTTMAISSQSTPITVGTGGPTSGQYFIGYINNTYVYNRILSPSEITQIFNNLKDRYGL